jgi:protein-S-isoprenylcysteine O-methyltransferase Ste14
MTRLQPSDDRPNRHHWPPILYVVTLVSAWGLGRLWPLPAIVVGSPPATRLIGVLLAAAGIAIGVLGILHFRQIGTAIDPTGRATTLADSGIYAWTRNPMYLGATLAFLGAGLAWPSTWLVLVTPLMAIGLQKLAIEREEAYLTRRFGDVYRLYTTRVRRWL